MTNQSETNKGILTFKRGGTISVSEYANDIANSVYTVSLIQNVREVDPVALRELVHGFCKVNFNKLPYAIAEDIVLAVAVNVNNRLTEHYNLWEGKDV